jgi:type I restriction enzyme S subunit
VAEDLPGVVCGYHLAHIRPEAGCVGAFLARAFSAIGPRDQFQISANGITRFGLGGDGIRAGLFAVPPESEQRTIASFLDSETAKIDASVAKKQRLIELLREKRTALITRAITRGLDLNVPTKNSGIDGFGLIPAHWDVEPLKRNVEMREGPGIMAADFTDEGVPLLRIAGIGGRTATLDGCNYLSRDLVDKRWVHFRVRKGDLLISGSASTGFCSEVDDETVGAVPYTGIMVMRPRAAIEKAFLRWYLLSRAFLTQTDLARSGTAIQHFGPTHLSRMFMVVPQKAEQRAIAAFLDQETATIDALVTEIDNATGHLKEMRAAIVSAAVAGKIDVRGEAA